MLLQVADIAFEPLGLPEWTMTLVLFLAMLVKCCERLEAEAAEWAEANGLWLP